MAKVSVPNCGVCGKAPELLIVWLKSGDTEWTCIACHVTQVVTMVAEQTELAGYETPAIPDPEAAGVLSGADV